MNSIPCSIFFHNYYGQHQKWMNFFSEKITVQFNLFYNIVDNSLYNLMDEQEPTKISGPYFNDFYLRKSSNQGKDIGGKLVLLDTYLRAGIKSEYMVFLHDKISPYKVHNQEWQKKLFRIVEPDFIERALSYFKRNKHTGIIANSDTINNEYDYSRNIFKSENGDQLKKLQSDFNIRQIDYQYVAGTMFWARTEPLINFFEKHPPLNIRKTLERGNVSDENKGSVTHAWERMLSWIIVSQGYDIKGI